MIRLRELAPVISRVIFEGETPPPGMTKFYLRAKGLHGVRVGPLTFVEQNTETNSVYGVAARMGSRIIWVFRDGSYWRGPEGTYGIFEGEWQTRMSPRLILVRD